MHDGLTIVGKAALITLPAWLIIAAFGAGMLLLPASGRATPAVPSSAPLLPDLVVEPPQSQDFQIGNIGADRVLKFGTLIVNQGTGPLEVDPVLSLPRDCNRDLDPTNDRSITQAVYEDTDGSGRFERPYDAIGDMHDAGCMTFSLAHDHWHVDNFATYELREGPNVVSRATKVSFCLDDSLPEDLTRPGASNDDYYVSCGDYAPQGISIGWADYYSSETPGQVLLLGAAPDGTYCLSETVDPANRFLESNESNNTTSVPLLIDGGRVERAPGAGC